MAHAEAHVCTPVPPLNMPSTPQSHPPASAQPLTLPLSVPHPGVLLWGARVQTRAPPLRQHWQPARLMGVPQQVPDGEWPGEGVPGDPSPALGTWFTPLATPQDPDGVEEGEGEDGKWREGRWRAVSVFSLFFCRMAKRNQRFMERSSPM